MAMTSLRISGRTLLIILLLAIIGSALFFQLRRDELTTVTFMCKNSKSIVATFNLITDKGVNLVLSDGRSLFVPHSISASGARYANEDETFVFWNKGNTAFITEGKDGNTTYEDCLIDGGVALL